MRQLLALKYFLTMLLCETIFGSVSAHSFINHTILPLIWCTQFVSVCVSVCVFLWDLWYCYYILLFGTYRGWGLRCLDDIPKGTFVCTYTGDIHTDAGANKVCNCYQFVDHMTVLWSHILQKGYCQGDEYLAELDYIGKCV